MQKCLISVALLVVILALPGGPALAKPSQEAIQQMVVSEAIRNGTVPPTLALAVARVESNFSADATSGAGARGVMQIMPATAQGEFGASPASLYDARTNIRLGIQFLHRLYQTYGYRWDLALSHYNGGTLKRAGGQWVPHGYTQKYVADVLTYWNRYQRERWVNVLIAEAKMPSGTAAAREDEPIRQAQMAADYAYLEDLNVDRDWRAYLRVADRYMADEGAASEPVAVDFSKTAAADPNWRYPLAEGGARRPGTAYTLNGTERFLQSSAYWVPPGAQGRFN